MGICYSFLASVFTDLTLGTIGNGQETHSLSRILTEKNWIFAAGGITTLLLIKQYFNKIYSHKAGDLESEEGNDGYKRENYEPDTVNGLLQTIERDEDDCFKLKLAKKIKLTHDTYEYM